MAQPAPQPSSPAFEGYRPFTEEEIVPWRQANDAVREIGGWRAYAREAQASARAASAPASAPAGRP